MNRHFSNSTRSLAGPVRACKMIRCVKCFAVRRAPNIAAAAVDVDGLMVDNGIPMNGRHRSGRLHRLLGHCCSAADAVAGSDRISAKLVHYPGSVSAIHGDWLSGKRRENAIVRVHIKQWASLLFVLLNGSDSGGVECMTNI